MDTRKLPKDQQRKLDELTRAAFVERWPQAFAPKGAPKWPIKEDIVFDIYNRMPELGFNAIRRAISNYCNGPTYCQSLIAGATRVDLAGKPVGVVTDAEAKIAAEKMDYFRSTKKQDAAA